MNDTYNMIMNLLDSRDEINEQAKIDFLLETNKLPFEPFEVFKEDGTSIWVTSDEELLAVLEE